MLRILGFGLLGIMTTLNTNAYALESHSLQQGVTLEYELATNVPQEFVNYMFWSVEAKCKIHTEDESDEFLVTALAKKGKVNGIALSSGDSLLISVHPNETLKLSADSGAKVRITNFGLHTVKATCST